MLAINVFTPQLLRACMLVVLSAVLASQANSQNAPLQQPAEALQDLFENFASNAGPMAPMFGKLSPEQREQLDRIKVSNAGTGGICNNTGNTSRAALRLGKNLRDAQKQTEHCCC